MADTVQDFEDGLRQSLPNSDPCVTAESAIVGVDVASMAGSGTSVFCDFADAVGWFWLRCEEYWGSGRGEVWISDDAAPTELREGRQHFRALLARFFEGGYTRDMEDEFRAIVRDLQDSDVVYEVGPDIRVLPTDLDDVLEQWRDLVSDDPEGDMVPPDPFDLSNPEHLGALRTFLEWLSEF